MTYIIGSNNNKSFIISNSSFTQDNGYSYFNLMPDSSQGSTTSTSTIIDPNDYISSSTHYKQYMFNPGEYKFTLNYEYVCNSSAGAGYLHGSIKTKNGITKASFQNSSPSLSYISPVSWNVGRLYDANLTVEFVFFAKIENGALAMMWSGGTGSPGAGTNYTITSNPRQIIQIEGLPAGTLP